MNIAVCVKQVPGTTKVEVDPVTGVLKRDGVESKLNPYDLYALEAGLRLREQYGGSLKTLTMGPLQAENALLETLYMGADEGFLATDRRFAGADVLATSRALSQALRLAGEFDLILCGKQTTDGDTAQVGPELAEFLNIPHVCNVLSTEVNQAGDITALCNQDGLVITLRIPMPCLLCLDGQINTPRLPSYKRKIALFGEKISRIKTVTLDDFSDKNEAHFGLSGSPTKVERIFPPEKDGEKEIFGGTGDELAEKLAHILRAKKYL